MSLSSHVAVFCQSGLYHFRQLCPLRRSLPAEATKTLVQAFILCRLDYCNSLLYEVTNKLMRYVQSVQNAAARLITERNVTNTSHRYCVNFTGCWSDDELNSRWPAWYTKCRQAKYLPIWLTIFISPRKVLLTPSGPLRGESALSLVLTVVLVTDVLLQLDHISGTTYLPVCETRKSAAQHSEDN